MREAEEISVRAWVQRVNHIASKISVKEFSSPQFDDLVYELLNYSQFVEDVAQVPNILEKYGVKFIILEHLPQTYIDGAAYWIDAHPTIVLTLRYDRIDSFWFTLFHELGHIKFSHEGHVDDLTKSEALSEMDKVANQWATEQLLDLNEFKAFIREHQPHYSKQAVKDFAIRNHRHPGIIVGQLQYRKEISYSTMRGYLEKVKKYLKPWIFE
jgi:HTH-type transcriptional regulator/antitoxin HigA